MYINYEIIVREIHEDGEIYQGEGFNISAFTLEHTKPCLGYSLTEESRPGIFYPEKAVEKNVPKGPLWSILQRGETVELEDGSKVKPDDVMGGERAGRKFSYVTDTLYLPKIADHVADSDLLICEGMFRHELAEDAAGKKHMTSVQAAMTAKNAGGVKTMGLIHYSPRYIDSDLKKMLREAQEVFPDTFLSRDGMQIDIPNVD